MVESLVMGLNSGFLLEPIDLGQFNPHQLAAEAQASQLPAMDAPPDGQGVDIPACGKLLDGEL